MTSLAPSAHLAPASHRPAQLAERLRAPRRPCVALLAGTRAVACLGGGRRLPAALLAAALRRAAGDHAARLEAESQLREELVS